MPERLCIKGVLRRYDLVGRGWECTFSGEVGWNTERDVEKKISSVQGAVKLGRNKVVSQRRLLTCVLHFRRASERHFYSF